MNYIFPYTLAFPFDQREIQIAWEHCNLIAPLIWVENMFQFYIFYTRPKDIVIKWPTIL